MRTLLLGAGLLAALSACDKPAPRPETTSPAAAGPPTAAKPVETPAATPKTHHGALAFVEDDYPGALTAAKEAGKPIFVDAWAPWCHVCLSMQSYVFPDPALASFADRYVYLQINTEAPENAAFTKKFAVQGLPTFFVVDPRDETVTARWLGSGSVAQMRAFLGDAERTYQLAHAGDLPKELALLRQGDQAVAAEKFADAAKAYADALAAAPADWPRRPDALVAEISALGEVDPSACLDLGLAHLSDTGNSVSASDFAASTLDCADKLGDDPRVEPARRAAAERLAALTADPAAPLTADDRGDGYRLLWDAREKLGDKDGARKAAEDRVAMLDAAAASAPDATAASTYDWARAESYLYLGRGDDAIKLLDQSEAALPKDYNPPNRLARVYHELKREDEALKAIDRALGKAYGPRKAGIYGLKVDILVALGRKDEAVATLNEELAHLDSLPDGQRRPAQVEAAQKRLAELTPPPPAVQ